MDPFKQNPILIDYSGPCFTRLKAGPGKAESKAVREKSPAREELTMDNIGAL